MLQMVLKFLPGKWTSAQKRMVVEIPNLFEGQFGSIGTCLPAEWKICAGAWRAPPSTGGSARGTGEELASADMVL